jgi:hypothetical protein
MMADMQLGVGVRAPRLLLLVLLYLVGLYI